MPTMSEKMKREMAFFLDENGQIQYNKTCILCEKDCKQSFRVDLVACPLFCKKEGN